MKKKILIALALIIAILAAAGCAGNQTSETPDETTEATTDFVVQTAPPVQSIQGKPEEEVAFEAAERLDPSLADVAPLPIAFDAENPDNATFHVSFNSDSLSGTNVNDVKVQFVLHEYDTYDMVDIATLKKGDTIIAKNEVVTVNSVEEEEYGIVINRSENEDGICFVPTDSGVYYVDTASALKDYYAVSQVTLPLSPEFVYTDYYKSAENPVVLTLEQFFTEDPEIDYDFNPDNTSIVVENGQVISLTRIQLP